MVKLVSEQLPNDGGYHIKRLVDEANARLKQIGKQGKRATIVAKGNSLTLQFTLNDETGKGQRNPGLGGIPVSRNGILEAENKAKMVTNQLETGTFTWDWYNKLIGKDTSEKVTVLTCREMVEQYKKHYFKQRKDDKYPDKSWYERCRRLEELVKDSDKPLSIQLVKEVIELTDNDTPNRAKTISGLIGFLKYFDNTDYKEIIRKYKADNKPKRRKRNVPSNKRITEIFNKGFVPHPTCAKKYRHRYPQWQFLYGLLATYGLRVHEAWNIANWDKPVILKNGDWVIVDVDDETEESKQYSGEELVIPAILDPSNKKHFLCIKHDTKTGYRMAMPLSPNGHNWIEEFNLLQELNLPDIENPLEKGGGGVGSYRCTDKTTKWFNRKGYSFTPHDLRYAYVHRGHHLGINPKVIADISGHSLIMSNTIYARDMSDSVKYEGMVNATNQEQEKRSENDLLKQEVKALKAEVEALKTENELLKTKLQLNMTLKESQ